MLNAFGLIVIGALNVNGLRYCHGFQETKKSCLLSLKKLKKNIETLKKKRISVIKKQNVKNITRKFEYRK